MPTMLSLEDSKLTDEAETVHLLNAGIVTLAEIYVRFRKQASVSTIFLMALMITRATTSELFFRCS